MKTGIGLVGASLVVALTGCSGSGDSTSGGPQTPSDGSYTYLAASAGGGAASAALEINGTGITLTQETGTTTATIGDPAQEAILCPPSVKGRPLTITAPLTIGTVALTSPAIFGDCGLVKPTRVTVIDLDSFDKAGGPFGFTRWVEFCDITDPDCQTPSG
jgi:hypothetical protein